MGGFSLVETMMAVSLCAVTISSFYVTMGQGMRLARTAHESALATQLLTQRLEALRASTLWTNVTTPSGVSGVISQLSPMGASISGATEQYSITTYPPSGTPITVSRTAAGVVTTSGSSLSSQKCIQVTLQTLWQGANKRPVSRSLSTILTKGGV